MSRATKLGADRSQAAFMRARMVSAIAVRCATEREAGPAGCTQATWAARTAAATKVAERRMVVMVLRRGYSGCTRQRTAHVSASGRSCEVIAQSYVRGLARLVHAACLH